MCCFCMDVSMGRGELGLRARHDAWDSVCRPRGDTDAVHYRLYTHILIIASSSHHRTIICRRPRAVCHMTSATNLTSISFDTTLQKRRRNSVLIFEMFKNPLRKELCFILLFIPTYKSCRIVYRIPIGNPINYNLGTVLIRIK